MLLSQEGSLALSLPRALNGLWVQNPLILPFLTLCTPSPQDPKPIWPLLALLCKKCSLGQAVGSSLPLHQLCISSPSLECKPHLTQHPEKVLPSFTLRILDTLKALSDCPVPIFPSLLTCPAKAWLSSYPLVSEFHSVCAPNTPPSTWSR